MSRRSREKDRDCGTGELCRGIEGGTMGGRENGRENRPVPSAAIDFARMQLHMQPPCIHLSRPSRFAGPARASERAAIN